MANRFVSPFGQIFDASTRDFLSGGKLYFYVTGTSAPTDTYTDAALTFATRNANPVVLDAAGRHGDIFLDPAVTYKVVLADADGNVIATRDPVVDMAANVTAAFQVYAGNPNGSVAGNAGSVGGSGASAVWDITNDLLYVCTTSGDAASAVWTQVGAALSGQVLRTGVISPTNLAANTDDWNPAGLSSASVIRIGADAAYNLTGITAQPTGTVLMIENVGAFNITLKNNTTSAAANRFQLPSDVVLAPDSAIEFRYDGVSSRWRATSIQAPPASDTLPGLIEIATQAEMEAGSDVGRAVTPGRQHFHPGHPKCWAMVSVSAGAPTLQTSHNIDSITDNGVGLITFTIATDFSSANWCCVGMGRALTTSPDSTDDGRGVMMSAQAAGTVQLTCWDFRDSPNVQDPASWHMVGFGDHS